MNAKLDGVSLAEPAARELAAGLSVSGFREVLGFGGLGLLV